jgi:mono/diheme cytochrome c family protein
VTWIERLNPHGRPGPWQRALPAIGVLAAAGCASLPRPPEARTPLERRGRHVLRIAVGCGCHGLNFAGWKEGGPDLLPRTLPYGERFTGPFGVIPAPNITPDPETGIGKWTDEQIARAIRDGIHPSGARLHPIMPYPAFHGMADSDISALVAYLRRLRPVKNRVTGKELSAAVPEPGPLRPAPERPPESGVALGKYLVENISTCGDCHTPHGPSGPMPEMLMAGNVLPRGSKGAEIVPNITPDRETGIERWSRNEIARYLRTGSRPDGGLAQSLMAGLIFSSFSHLTKEEAQAIAAYLKTIPPVHHRPEERLPQERGARSVSANANGCPPGQAPALAWAREGRCLFRAATVNEPLG